MSCKFSDPNGFCQLIGDGIERNGCDTDGACICEDDEEPLDTCEDYVER